MTRTPPEQVSQLLENARHGSQEALDQLVPLVYTELHRLAASYLRKERADHTLQPTALVNEAYLKLLGQQEVRWENRAHFLAIAAQTMRRILVDHARSRLAAKRGGGAYRITLHEGLVQPNEEDVNLLRLDDAINRLRDLDPQKSQIVELRFFGGLTLEDTAEVLGVSAGTVKNGWRMAKAWLHQEVMGKAAKKSR